jgi:hypothetical protein
LPATIYSHFLGFSEYFRTVFNDAIFSLNIMMLGEHDGIFEFTSIQKRQIREFVLSVINAEDGNPNFD